MAIANVEANIKLIAAHGPGLEEFFASGTAV
jgi:hypothetical protein